MKKITKRPAFLIGMVFSMLLINFDQVSAQCTFNCHDTINVSVNINCMARITPDLILEGADLITCEYGLTIFQEDGVTPLATQPDVGMSEVGLTLKVRVFENGNPNGASCWGYIKVEDKLPPPLECAGNDTLPCFMPDPFFTNELAESELESRIQSVIQETDNCGDEEIDVLVLSNDLDRQYCMDSFSARRIIMYQVFDNDRNVLECIDSIYYLSLPLDTLTPPKNYVEDMALNCTDSFPTVGYLLERDGDISVPNYNGTALNELIDSLFFEKEDILCNFKMTYSDIIFPTCGSTFKIVREWTVIDWCNANRPETFNQIIKVEDNEISIVSGCDNIGGQVADPETCTAEVQLPVPMLSEDECSEWTYAIYVQDPGSTVFELFGNAVRDTANGPVIRDFNLGISMVRYVVTDACENIDSCIFQVEVIDEDAPIAVCDYRTVITLTDSFLGKARALSFDDGSIDLCSGISKYEVRRLDRDSTGCETPSDFDPFVKFCCEDVGKTVFIEFRVTDGAGLTSTCITEAVIQYKGPGPDIVCPASPSNADCGVYDSYDLSTLTRPTIMSDNPCIADNLIPQVREIGRAIDSCGNGFIRYEWFVNLTGEEEVICQDQVTFENQNIFTEADINWPADRNANSCNETGVLDSELTNLIPVVGFCNNVVASDPVDRVFDNVSGVCSRIVRTWTVVDWCRFPADLGARWTFQQTISVLNSMPPVINQQATSADVINDIFNCRAEINALGVASDDCTDEDNLSWRIMVVQDGITIVPSSESNVLNTVLPMGTYQIQWSVSDECNNETTFDETIVIEDTQAPSLTCNSMELDIDSITQDVVVTVVDFSEGSFDNCDATFEIGMRRAGTDDELTQLVRFTCQELGPNEVELVATDDAGNTSSCTGFINVRNIDDACNFGATAIQLNGEIFTENGTPIEEALVTLMQSDIAAETSMSNIDGEFAFSNLVSNTTYNLESVKDDDYRNGLSTADIIHIQNHILDIRDLNSPYRYLAADVNGSGSISALDLLLIRRVILEQLKEFPNQPSWKFLDGDVYFERPYDIWDYNAAIEVYSDQEQISITGVKLGDVTGDAIANSAISGGRNAKIYSTRKSVQVESGKAIVEIRSLDKIKSYGLQLSLHFENENYRFQKLESEFWDIDDGMIYNKEGQLNISISSSAIQSINEEDVVLKFYFESISSTDNDLNLTLNNNAALSSEIYDEDLEAYHLQIRSDERNPHIELFQNRPNPFGAYTTVEFTLPSRQEAEFSVYDLNGKRVFYLEQLFVAGLNQIRLSKEGLGLNKGIYYYQIQTHDRSLIKKMIIL